MAIDEYCTNAEAEKHIPQGIGGLAVDDQFIIEAQGIVDSKLAGKYTTPFAKPIVLNSDLQEIKTITCWLSAYLQIASVFGENTPVEIPDAWNRRQQALDALDDFAAGTRKLSSSYLLPDTSGATVSGNSAKAKRISPALQWNRPVDPYDDLSQTSVNTAQ